MSRLAFLVAVSYAAAAVIAWPTFRLLATRVGSTLLRSVFAAAVAGIIAGALLAVWLHLREDVWAAPGVISDIPIVSFVGALVGLALSIPAIFVLYARFARQRHAA